MEKQTVPGGSHLGGITRYRADSSKLGTSVVLVMDGVSDVLEVLHVSANDHVPQSGEIAMVGILHCEDEGE